jgi:hypothetical protein
LLALWLVVLALFFYSGIVFAVVRTHGLAQGVLEGKRIPPVGLTFVFDVHADPVCVSVNDSGGSPRQPAYRLYLGEANGWLALYDPV